MKRDTPEKEIPLHEQIGIDITKTVILGGEDIGLRQHGKSILLMPPKGDPGFGILLCSKVDYFNGMPGKHDFGFINMMELSMNQLLLEQEYIYSLHAFFVEQQMNRYNQHPNAPGMMAVFSQCYAMGRACGIPTYIVPPLQTANCFPSIFPKDIPIDFEPTLKNDEEKRRHAWNKYCICRVAHQITTPREMETITNLNDKMEAIARMNRYKFKADIDDYLDPLTDIAAFLLDLYKDDIDQFDLLKLRMRYRNAGYKFKYLVFSSKIDLSTRDFPQQWRENKELKIWYCCIKISPNIPLAKLLLDNFRFDYYISDCFKNDVRTWIQIEKSPITWDDLFAFFKE
jgi:hypothetical protein